MAAASQITGHFHGPHATLVQTLGAEQEGRKPQDLLDERTRDFPAELVDA